MRTVAQVIDLISSAIEFHAELDHDSIKGFRYRALEHMRDFLTAHGWPESREDRLALSLVPLVFQEANYDAIEWTVQVAPLRDLELLFCIDVLVQSKGRTRVELSNDEFSKYIQLSFAAIDSRSR